MERSRESVVNSVRKREVYKVKQTHTQTER